MGSKRSYADEEALQLPYKYLKQFATDEKLNTFADEKLASITSILPGNESIDNLNFFVGHNGHADQQLVDPFEVKRVLEASTVVEKGLVDGLRFPWVTDSHGDDRGWYRDFHGTLSPEYFESNFSRRAHVFVDDPPLSSFLDCYPRKKVPVGANHQADLPTWVPNVDSRSNLSAPNSNQVIASSEEERYMGTCVIPMPDSTLFALNSISAGAGRKDCDCVDTGSARCVRQHVKEARFKLLNFLGEDRFRELGFLDIGEEVAHKWTEEEEKIFHKVVFSNPASLGKDFWSCISEEFPSRSMRDIVNYYFNVFMLRKRAAQNRSHLLDIDSDDDEWHPGHGGSYGIGFVSEDDDSILVHDEDYSDEDDDIHDHDSDVDEGTSSGNAEKEESSQPNMGFFRKERDFIPGNHEDSCISFDYRSGINDSTSTQTGVRTKEIIQLKNNKYFSADQIESDDGLIPGCLDYSGNFRQWDQGFPAGLDHFLPTSNMIEEIFGPGTWNNIPDHD